MWNPFADASRGAVEGAGKAVEGVGNAIKAVVGAFKEDPTMAGQRISELEQAYVKLEETSQAAINATMQSEAKSEHWAQWMWRPTIGFTFSAVLINNYILTPYLAQYGVTPIAVPDEVWAAMLVILGASAAGRSWEKVKREH